MAGSYGHIVNEQGQFRGIDLIDNLGDAHEALEECYGMIQYLASSLVSSTRPSRREIIDQAQQNYRQG